MLASCGDEAKETNNHIDSPLKLYTFKSANDKLYKVALCSKESFSDKFLLNISQVSQTRSLMICGDLNNKMSMWTCCNNKKISLLRYPGNKKCYTAKLPTDVELFSATYIKMSNQDEFSLSGLEG